MRGLAGSISSASVGLPSMRRDGFRRGRTGEREVEEGTELSDGTQIVSVRVHGVRIVCAADAALEAGTEVAINDAVLLMDAISRGFAYREAGESRTRGHHAKPTPSWIDRSPSAPFP